MISYGKQTIDKSDIDAVVQVLKGDWLTQGQAVEIFENDLFSFINIHFMECWRFYFYFETVFININIFTK